MPSRPLPIFSSCWTAASTRGQPVEDVDHMTDGRMNAGPGVSHDVASSDGDAAGCKNSLSAARTLKTVFSVGRTRRLRVHACVRRSGAMVKVGGAHKDRSPNVCV